MPKLSALAWEQSLAQVVQRLDRQAEGVVRGPSLVWPHKRPGAYAPGVTGVKGPQTAPLAGEGTGGTGRGPRTCHQGSPPAPPWPCCAGQHA